jgi:hypothetical protein
MANCILCESPCDAGESLEALSTHHRFNCPRCGEYIVTDGALLNFDPPRGFVKENLHLLSAVIRNSWDRRERFRIDAKVLEDRSEFEARVLSSSFALFEG